VPANYTRPILFIDIIYSKF